MLEYVIYAIVALFYATSHVEGANKTTVYGFDNAVCLYNNYSSGGPVPLWALGYSTDVEWKNVLQKKVVNVKEYSDPINKMRSMSASVEGANVQMILNDKEDEYYTVVDSCKVTTMYTSMIFFPPNYGLEWLSMSYEWYKLMNQTTVVQKNATTIRSIVVNHWSTCVYILNIDITAQVDFYFSNQWTFPLVQPNVINPVRVEIIGRKHGQGKYFFHIIGDFYNFNPAPPKNPLSTQPPPGVFCPDKYPGKLILGPPTNFYGIIEIIDREFKTIVFKEIWFHYDQKYVRYDTKTSSNSDSDPYMNILDFNTGIKYKIDKYIGTCDQNLVVIGDNFVKQSNNNAFAIALMSAAEFFHLENAQTQYVGKRWARDILCDVWVGRYFDQLVSRTLTAEWYFASEGWSEAVGLSLQTGSLIKMDIFADASVEYPTTWHIHRLDPTKPSLSSFDINSCFNSAQKIRFIIRFHVSNKNVIPGISKSYLKDKLQYEMTKLAMIDPTRMSDISTEHFDGDDFYFAATLLDRPSQVNSRVQRKNTFIDVNGAFHFLRAQIGGNWSTNVTARTGETVIFYGVNMIQLNYQDELTTTTIPTIPTKPYITPPTPPLPGHKIKTTFPTPPIPDPTLPSTHPTTKLTTHTLGTTAGDKPTTKPTPNKQNSTPKPCICPKTTCPVWTTPKPPPQKICPTVQQTPKASKKQTTPNVLVLKTTLGPKITSQPNCSAIIANMQKAAQSNKTNGVSKGALAGAVIAMLVVGMGIGIVATWIYLTKFRKIRPGLINHMDDDSRY